MLDRDLTTLKIVDVSSGATTQTLRAGKGSPLEAVALSPDSKVIGAVSVGSPGKTFFWDIATGNQLLTAQANTPWNSTSTNFFVRDPQTMFFFDRTGHTRRIVYWNVAAGDVQGEWAEPSLLDIKAVATTPDGAVLAVYTADGMLTLYDVSG